MAVSNIKAEEGIDIGEIQAFAGDLIPLNWLLCDGAVLSRTKFSELFSIIGTTWGGGDGSTTFALPDLSNRTIMGDMENSLLGTSGGEEKHLLTTSELPGHAHNEYLRAQYGSGTVSNAATIVSGYWDWGKNGSATTGPMNVNTSSTGNSNPYSVMQPYCVINYIIYAGKC